MLKASGCSMKMPGTPRLSNLTAIDARVSIGAQTNAASGTGDAMVGSLTVRLGRMPSAVRMELLRSAAAPWPMTIARMSNSRGFDALHGLRYKLTRPSEYTIRLHGPPHAAHPPAALCNGHG